LLFGVLLRRRLADQPFEMQPGETLVAFTDWVTDTVGDGDERFASPPSV